MQPTNTVYYSGLTGLRAIAAVMVIIAHTCGLKQLFQPTNTHFIQVTDIGYYGVMLFFVISGFLITNLLLIEQKNTSTTNVKHFYMRRMLRIWPLYFFVLLLSFLIERYYLHANQSVNAYLLLTFFLGNYAERFMNLSFMNSHLWSIAIEEQFYIVWPWVMCYKRKMVVATIIVIVYYFFKFFFYYNSGYGTWFEFIIKNLYAAFVMGAAGALAFHYKVAYIFKFLQLKLVQWVILLTLVYFSFVKPIAINPTINFDLFAFLSLLLIIAIVHFKFLNKFLESNLLVFVGKISYGIYLFQNIVCYFVVANLYSFLPKNINQNLLFSFELLTSIVISVLLAYVAHLFIEKPFLTIKDKFSKLKTSYSKS